MHDREPTAEELAAAERALYGDDAPELEVTTLADLGVPDRFFSRVLDTTDEVDPEVWVSALGDDFVCVGQMADLDGDEPSVVVLDRAEAYELIGHLYRWLED